MVLDALSRVATGVAILLLGAASACAADVDCMAQPLGPIDTWSIVVNGDLVQSNTDSEGRVAAGRDVTLTSYGVASQLPVDGSRVDLVAGRDLTGSNLVVDHGSVSYGRNLYGSVTAPNGTVTRAAPQQDFATLFSAAEARSTVWGALTPDGTVSGPVYGALTLTGESAKLNVFTIAASTLQQAQRILIKVPFGSSTLINVTGTTYTTAQYPTTSVEFWNGSSFQQFGNAAPSPELEAMRRAMLWNFPDATDVQIGPSLAWQGSVLAPLATNPVTPPTPPTPVPELRDAAHHADHARPGPQHRRGDDLQRRRGPRHRGRPRPRGTLVAGRRDGVSETCSPSAAISRASWVR
ncbi:MAG TPA: choice-of-anchor A family protein [Baekduia sp.]|nr:choice-of-anchor A family protein [Baekduia sp.]